MADLCSPFTTLTILLGIRFRTFNLELIRAVGVFGFQTMRADGVSPHVIDGGVVRDAVKPRRKLVFGAVARKRVVDFYEDFLRNVERGFVVAQHSEDVARDRTLIAADETFKAILASAHGRRDQLEIRELACIFNGCGGCCHDAWVLRYFP